MCRLTTWMLSLAMVWVHGCYASATEFNADKAYPEFHVGVTGLLATFEPGGVMKVAGALPDSPAGELLASGQLKEGDVVTSINQRPIAGDDPRQPLGEALLAADASDGRIVLGIERDGESLELPMTIATLGGYSKTWPVDCAKSDAMVKTLADQLAASQRDSGSYQMGPKGEAPLLDTGLNGCMATLFLLSTGDESYLPHVRRFVHKLAKQVEQRPTYSSWHLGYQLMVLSEYYLKTGDTAVLPGLRVLSAQTLNGQIAGSWGHSMNDEACGYVQSGQMNSAGVTVLLGLTLARECGVVEAEEPFDTALRFFYRMPGHGSICYGDHRAEIFIDTNGRNAAVACTMSLLPEHCYQASAEHLAMIISDSYGEPEVGHTGGGFNMIWRGLGTRFLPADQQFRYRRHMDQLAWMYELCRLPGGGFQLLPSSPSCETRYTSRDWGVSLGLTYTAPRRQLRILGGPPTQYSVQKPLSQRPWGSARDLEFLRCDDADGYQDAGELPHIIFQRLKGKELPSVDYLANLMRHFNPMVRTWAGQRLVEHRSDEAYDAIEAALAHPDVRVRRAGCDAISTYHNWQRKHNQVVPRAIVSQRFAPYLQQMLQDPQRAWWEADGALWALGYAEPEDIRRMMPTIRRYAKSDEWYLRESAYWAIVGLMKDIHGDEFLVLADMFLDSRSVYERGSYDGGINTVLRSKPQLGDEAVAAYARRIGRNMHSALLASGYDQQVAQHEATHRTMMILKHFDHAPYRLLVPDFVEYLKGWQPGNQHSNWLITGSRWQLGLVEVANEIGDDAEPMIEEFEHCLAHAEWDDKDKNQVACREAMEQVVAKYHANHSPSH